MSKKFSTNLKCQSCVATVKSFLDRHPNIGSWSVDTTVPDKVLSIDGSASETEVRAVLNEAGFSLLGPVEVSTTSGAGAAAQTARRSWLATYRPLLLIVGYLLGTVLICELALGEGFQTSRLMRHFMGGFFVVFSFFKLLDLRGFARSFEGYDLVARSVPGYGLVYPFVELLLGVAYLLNFAPAVTNCVTAIVMLAGLIGVVSVLRRGQKVQCACLGTVFDLPMSVVTFIENGTMIVMALAMLVGLAT